MALGMTRLQAGEFREVCPGQADPLRPALVIGPGTGLGVGSLLRLAVGSSLKLDRPESLLEPRLLDAVRSAELAEQLHLTALHTSLSKPWLS